MAFQFAMEQTTSNLVIQNTNHFIMLPDPVSQEFGQNISEMAFLCFMSRDPARKSRLLGREGLELSKGFFGRVGR